MSQDYLQVSEENRKRGTHLVTVRVEVDVSAAAAERAAKDGTNRSALMRGLLRYYAAGGQMPKALMREVMEETREYTGSFGGPDKPLPKVR